MKFILYGIVFAIIFTLVLCSVLYFLSLFDNTTSKNLFIKKIKYIEHQCEILLKDANNNQNTPLGQLSAETFFNNSVKQWASQIIKDYKKCDPKKQNELNSTSSLENIELQALTTIQRIILNHFYTNVFGEHYIYLYGSLSFIGLGLERIYINTMTYAKERKIISQTEYEDSLKLLNETINENKWLS